MNKNEVGICELDAFGEIVCLRSNLKNDDIISV